MQSDGTVAAPGGPYSPARGWRNGADRYGLLSTALFHHYILRDNTLRRMLPGSR